MRIRGERTWCERCQAPELMAENVPLVQLFLDLLPAYRLAGGWGESTLQEGFDRTALVPLMDLHRIAPDARADAWEALRDLEAELRHVRSAARERETRQP